MSSQTTFIPPLIHNPTSDHTHTLILIHPRSSRGRDFSDRIFSNFTNSNTFKPSNFLNWRIVLPSSKQIHNTEINGPRNAWFDQYTLINSYEKWEVMKAGLTDSVSYIKTIISSEVERLGHGKSENVVVMGMSMGAATALWSVISYYGDNNNNPDVRLGGYISQGGWLPFVDEIESFLAGASSSGEMSGGPMDFVKTLVKDPQACSSALSKTPMFWGHGTDDEWVNFKHGERAVEMLRGVGANVEFKHYQGAEDEGHWFKEPEELDDVAVFLKKLEGKS